MQLRNARLCLDCEELHEQQECPVCTSESFAYVTRWLPSGERTNPDRPAARTKAAAKAPRSTTRAWVSRGLAGLAVMTLSRIFLKPAEPAEASGAKSGDGGAE